MSGPREDYQTNTVDGAAAFERGRSLDDRFDDWGPTTDDDPGLDEGLDEDDEEEEEGPCCSDFSCPCGG